MNKNFSFHVNNLFVRYKCFIFIISDTSITYRFACKILFIAFNLIILSFKFDTRIINNTRYKPAPELFKKYLSAECYGDFFIGYRDNIKMSTILD